ncbi:MAG TPA: hypothetical protein VGQ49_19400 [Bryobacteraceae bacterium]|jgi:hypothetical protein|nr:hypothetical protein [Bryobacteraceae bacterium]
MAENRAVFGIFTNSCQADKTVSRLTSAGFSNSDISVLSAIIDGLLAGLGFPDSRAEAYEARVKKGCILVSVHCANSLETGRANIILEENGAEDIFAISERASESSRVIPSR